MKRSTAVPAPQDECRVQTRSSKLGMQNLKPVVTRKQLNPIPLRSMRQKENQLEIQPQNNQIPRKRAALSNLINQFEGNINKVEKCRTNIRSKILKFGEVGNRTNQIVGGKRPRLAGVNNLMVKTKLEVPANKVRDEKPVYIERKNEFPVPYADDLEEFSFPDLAFSIYENLRQEEQTYQLSPGYLKSHSRLVTPKSRARLIEWLIQAHAEFHLTTETLHSAVSIFDRFLQIKNICKSAIKLYAVTSLFIASKLEETYLPAVEDFVISAEGLFKKFDILTMEFVMCTKLAYDMGCPTSLQFLRRFSKIGKMTHHTHCFAKFLLELAFFDPIIVHWKPSYTAAAALYTVRYIYEKEPYWNDCLTFHSTYNASYVEAGAQRLAKLSIKPHRKAYQSVFDKYSTSRLLSISQCAQQAPLLRRFKQLAGKTSQDLH